MGVKRKSPTTPKPDQSGSRAANTAHFAQLLNAWLDRGRVSRTDAAIILCVSERTIENWQRGRSAPRGITRHAIEDLLQFRHHLKGEQGREVSK
jgi:hypothetical protein